MHIGLCSPHWPPSGAANGIVSYVAAVRNHFIASGHEASVIADGQLFLSDGSAVPLTQAEDGGGLLARLQRKAIHRIDSFNDGAMPEVGRIIARQINAARAIAPIDIVEMEESFGWSDTVRRRTAVPIVTRLHGPHFLKPPRPRTPDEQRADRQRMGAEGRAVRGARTLTAPTRAVMDATCKQYERAASAASAVIPNPIALAPPAIRWRADACEPDHILAVGRFDYWKGADTMLRAFDTLLRSRPQARLTLVGPDMGLEVAAGKLVNYDAFVAEHLSPEARARTRYLGKQTPDQITALRHTAQVTVCASRWENFPYALLEGFAAGCPMICTDWPGGQEIIVDGETGLLTPVGDADALAARLDMLLGDPALMARIAEGGFIRCRDHFSVEAVGAQLLDCYRAALEGKS